MVRFVVLKVDLLRTLTQLYKLKRSAKKKQSTLEITLTKDTLTFNIPGAQLNLEAHTSGSAKLTLRLAYFLDIIQTLRDVVVVAEIKENQLTISNKTFTVLTTFFENDEILRSIDMPLNYNDIDLANLSISDKYTKSELDFNNLLSEAERAKIEITKDTKKVYSILSKYGFSYNEVVAFIKTKLVT